MNNLGLAPEILIYLTNDLNTKLRLDLNIKQAKLKHNNALVNKLMSIMLN